MTKISILGIIGCFGAVISNAFGGFSNTLLTLLIFMVADYFTGLIVGGVFHTSPKTPTGGLESKAGWKGLIRKFATLLLVLIAARLDLLMGTDYLKDCVIIAFIVNESLSIIENVGLMGAPLPAVLVKAIDVLNEKSDKNV